MHNQPQLRRRRAVECVQIAMNGLDKHARSREECKEEADSEDEGDSKFSGIDAAYDAFEKHMLALHSMEDQCVYASNDCQSDGSGACLRCMGMCRAAHYAWDKGWYSSSIPPAKSRAEKCEEVLSGGDDGFDLDTVVRADDGSCLAAQEACRVAATKDDFDDVEDACGGCESVCEFALSSEKTNYRLTAIAGAMGFAVFAVAQQYAGAAIEATAFARELLLISQREDDLVHLQTLCRLSKETFILNGLHGSI